MAGGQAQAIAMAATPRLETWTLSVAELRDWVATAQAGATLTYAVERMLARTSETAAFARRLEAAGQASLTQRGTEMAGVRAYVIRRLRPGRVSIGRDPRPKKPQMDGDMARVMNVLRGCVRRGQPCPSNRNLAKAAGVTDAKYTLQKLVKAGFIRSRIVDVATGARIVTIVATGAETATPGGRR